MMYWLPHSNRSILQFTYYKYFCHVQYPAVTHSKGYFIQITFLDKYFHFDGEWVLRNRNRVFRYQETLCRVVYWLFQTPKNVDLFNINLRDGNLNFSQTQEQTWNFRSTVIWQTFLTLRQLIQIQSSNSMLLSRPNTLCCLSETEWNPQLN